jgi:DNA-binding transcriptional regulator YhcF (GntR family)
MFKIDETSRVPKFQQVAAEMRRRIRAGEWQVGNSVGDVNTLAAEFGCSFGTVGSAERELVKEGLLSEIRPGLKTRVIAVPADEPKSADDATLAKLKKIQRDLAAVIAEIEAA